MAKRRSKTNQKREAVASRPKTYVEAGVSIAAGEELVAHLRKTTPTIGGFSGRGRLPAGMKNPRLLMATDGVGTKLLVAQLAGIHHTIGIDLVAMVVNDLIVGGGRPLYFLDYFATGRLEQGVARQVLRGIVKGCREARCELIGGETAEMPGMYGPGHYDLAGFGVGAVEAGREIDGRDVESGDIVLGLASSGLHSNGFSLARAALLPESPAAARRALERPFAGSRMTLASVLLRPTRIYVRAVLDLVAHHRIGAMANVTGGGIEGNLARVLPRGARALIHWGSWKVPKIFGEIARRGPVEMDEMLKTFNMGIGYLIVARPQSARRIIDRCRAHRQPCRAIGWIDSARRSREPPEVLILDA